MSSELATTPVTPGFQKATALLSETLGIAPAMMIESLKKQCFPNMQAADISDAQLAAFISVANTMQLNPLIPGMLYAYPSKNGGIIPVSGPDGVLKKLDEQISSERLEGYECIVYPEDVSQKPTHAIAKIWRKGNERPATFTAIFSEWIVGQNPNWNTRPRHMIWLRAIKQCARQVIHGVPFDEDDVKMGDMMNVTPDDAPAQKRADAPARSKKGAAAVVENPPANGVRTDTKIVEGEFTDAPRESTNTGTFQKDLNDLSVAAKAKHEAAEVDKAMKEREAKLAAEKAEAKIKHEARVKEMDAIAKKLQDEKDADEAAAKKPVEATVPTVRAFLKDGEEISTECIVKDVSPLMVNMKGDNGQKVATPSVLVMLTGGYVGPCHHFGGATGTDPNKLEPLPLWTPGNKVNVKLLGKMNKATTGEMAGKVMVRVLEVTEAKSVSPAMEVE